MVGALVRRAVADQRDHLLDAAVEFVVYGYRFGNDPPSVGKVEGLQDRARLAREYLDDERVGRRVPGQFGQLLELGVRIVFYGYGGGDLLIVAFGFFCLVYLLLLKLDIPLFVEQLLEFFVRDVLPLVPVL